MPLHMFFALTGFKQICSYNYISRCRKGNDENLVNNDVDHYAQCKLIFSFIAETSINFMRFYMKTIFREFGNYPVLNSVALIQHDSR